ncbi:4-hydroxy-3-methylbut-2-enyl diphosphate reductase [Fidelibacter multiformis]|jgi:4-hydroxy-3-methylbut-2-enyl diphosphate reductase|uniref:4-hydroxy-3-methylbut-2-enyl diphosphate reductase n=1 Tax=Fidelibacter multiformis TaxID=3377529 RepID=UPI0037DD6E58
MKSKSRITIDVAKGCGFCAGVRRAVQMAEDAAQKHGRVTMLGDIVHNEAVIGDLARQGVQVVDSPDHIPQDAPVLLRAHGTTPAVEDSLYGRGFSILDATCPLVREIHKAIRELEKEGRRCLIVGDHGHDEVIGIAGQVKDAVVIATPEEARNLPTMKKAGVVSQSTQTQANLQAIVAELIPGVLDLRVVNTICAPSRLNQKEAERVARENEAVIVIGSETSANTRRLEAVVRKLNPKVLRIASADELDIEVLKSVQSIGITAGASTPDAVIRDVIEKIQTI